MAGILRALELRRKKQVQGGDYPCPYSVESIRFPLQLVVPRPTKPPVFYDKIKLLELGLTDLEAEIVLVLWEYRQPMFIFNRHRDTDLLREICSPRSTIQRAVSRLEKIGLVTRVDQVTGSLLATEPVEYSKVLEKTLTARINCVVSFLEFKQDELASR